jgi:hypothetical protein
MATWAELLASVTAVFFLCKWFKFQHTRAKVGQQPFQPQDKSDYVSSGGLTQLSHIPTLGSDWFLVSYLDAWRFVFKGHLMIEEGYAKVNGPPMFVTISDRVL